MGLDRLVAKAFGKTRADLFMNKMNSVFSRNIDEDDHFIMDGKYYRNLDEFFRKQGDDNDFVKREVDADSSVKRKLFGREVSGFWNTIADWSFMPDYKYELTDKGFQDLVSSERYAARPDHNRIYLGRNQYKNLLEENKFTDNFSSWLKPWEWLPELAGRLGSTGLGTVISTPAKRNSQIHTFRDVYKELNAGNILRHTLGIDDDEYATSNDKLARLIRQNSGSVIRNSTMRELMKRFGVVENQEDIRQNGEQTIFYYDKDAKTLKEKLKSAWNDHKYENTILRIPDEAGIVRDAAILSFGGVPSWLVYKGISTGVGTLIDVGFKDYKLVGGTTAGVLMGLAVDGPVLGGLIGATTVLPYLNSKVRDDQRVAKWLLTNATALAKGGLIYYTVDNAYEPDYEADTTDMFSGIKNWFSDRFGAEPQEPTSIYETPHYIDPTTDLVQSRDVEVAPTIITPESLTNEWMYENVGEELDIYIKDGKLYTSGLTQTELAEKLIELDLENEATNEAMKLHINYGPDGKVDEYDVLRDLQYLNPDVTPSDTDAVLNLGEVTKYLDKNRYLNEALAMRTVLADNVVDPDDISVTVLPTDGSVFVTYRPGAVHLEHYGMPDVHKNLIDAGVYDDTFDDFIDVNNGTPNDYFQSPNWHNWRSLRPRSFYFGQVEDLNLDDLDLDDYEPQIEASDVKYYADGNFGPKFDFKPNIIPMWYPLFPFKFDMDLDDCGDYDFDDIDSIGEVHWHKDPCSYWDKFIDHMEIKPTESYENFIELVDRLDLFLGRHYHNLGLDKPWLPKHIPKWT